MKQSLYYGGTIITMEDTLYAEAVIVEDGRIKYAGSEKEAFEQIRPDCECINLEGRTLLPGFIDGHSHITALANTLGLVPLNDAKSFKEIAERIKAFKEKRHIKPGQWIMGFGYDHNFLEEKRHPDKSVLDSAADGNPVMISHASGHMGVINSLGLSELGITENTPDPQGGKIGRLSGSMQPDGYLEENAFTGVSAKIPAPEPEAMMEQMALAQDVYLKNGITTIQDGLTKSKEWAMLKMMSDKGLMKADIVAYADIRDNAALVENNPEYVDKYKNRLKIGGYKLFLDGSPQGRTAWLEAPYENAEDGYRGYPIYDDASVEAYMEKAVSEGRQILVHCNGDAAAAQMIRAYEKALKRGGPVRPVMIHAQLVTKAQLEKMAALGMMASFFVAHTYYWGDIHYKNLGENRAMRISPVKTSIEEGVLYTFHQDSPVLPPDMIDTLWCAVSRISRGGRIMGGKERISVLEALKAITINGAYQYFEEDKKGSIKAGKQADFVILNKNPLDLEPEALKDIRIEETIKDGISVMKNRL